MSNGFPDGSYQWRAVELGGIVRCKANGDIASELNPKSLREFELVPQRTLQKPLVKIECPLEQGVLEFFENGGFKLRKPHLLDSIKVIRRRDFNVGQGMSAAEVWFVGLSTEGLPTGWIHVRPGFTEVTLRAPPE